MSSKQLQPTGLTIKQENFCREYIRNACNGTKAAIAAFNTESENSAAVMASNLIRNHKVQEYIKAHQQDLLISLKIDKTSRFKRLAEVFYKDDTRASISASRELNKMLGEYAPAKIMNLTPKEAIDKVLKEGT